MENNNVKKNDGKFVCTYCDKAYDTVEEMAKCILNCSEKAKKANKENARRIAEEKIKKANDEKSGIFNTNLTNISNNLDSTMTIINKYLNDELFSYTGNVEELARKIVYLRKSTEKFFNILDNIRNDNKFNIRNDNKSNIKTKVNVSKKQTDNNTATTNSNTTSKPNYDDFYLPFYNLLRGLWFDDIWDNYDSYDNKNIK